MIPAENTNLQENSVNLITVAQAVHWFDFERFYQEVRRVGTRNGIIAVWSYGMHKIDSEIDKMSEKLTVGGEVLGNYWPQETKYVKEDYKTIPFPFEEIDVPKFEMSITWSFDDLFVYMETWSSVKRAQKLKNYNPLNLVKEDMKNLWGKDDEQKLVRWIINLRIGVIHS